MKALRFSRACILVCMLAFPILLLAAKSNEQWIVACELKCLNSDTGKHELVNAWYSDEEGKAVCFERQFDDSGIFTCKIMTILFCDEMVQVVNDSQSHLTNCKTSSTTCWPKNKRLESLTPKPICRE